MTLTLFHTSSLHNYQEKSDFSTSRAPKQNKKKIIITPQMIAKIKFKSQIFEFILALLYFLCLC